MIMCGSLNTPLGILYIEIKLLQLLQDKLIDRNPMISDYYSAAQRNTLNVFAPRMRIYLLQSVPFSRVYV
jgi:hypothetical protein